MNVYICAECDEQGYEGVTRTDGNTVHDYCLDCPWCNEGHDRRPEVRKDGVWWHTACWRMHKLGQPYV